MKHYLTLSFALSFAIFASLAPGVRAANLDCPVGTSLSFDGTTCEKPNQTPNATPAPAPQKLTCPIGTSLSLDGTKCETPANATPVAPPSGAPPTTEQIKLINPLGISGANGLETFLGEILDFVIRIGTIAVILMMVFVGFKFVTAKGDPGEITKAREMLLWTVVGALILLGAKALAGGIEATVKALSTGN